MVKFITWILLLGMGAFITFTLVDIIKTLRARKEARVAGVQNKTDEKEVDHSNHS